MSCRAGKSVSGLVKNNKISPANRAMVSLQSPIRRPCNLSVLETYIDRGSIAILKSSGDSGQTCLVLLCKLNVAYLAFGVKILVQGLEYRFFNRCIMGPEKPSLSITSNAFSASSVTKCRCLGASWPVSAPPLPFLCWLLRIDL